MSEEKKFTWIPFYEEFAQKLYDYKDNRSKLIEIVMGVREKYRDYLTNKLFSKVDDIDPFTVFGLLNRSTFQRRNEIAAYFKDALGMTSPTPDDWQGIPILNNINSVYANKNGDIDLLWKLFVDIQESSWFNDSDFDNALQIDGVALAKLTMAFFWMKPEKLCPLDNNTMCYLKDNYSWQIDKKKSKSLQYSELRTVLNEKIQNGEVRSIPMLSYIAWKVSRPTDECRFWSGGIKWGDDNKFEDFKQNEYWQIGWNQSDESKGAKQAWKNIKKVKDGDLFAFHSYGGSNDLTIWQISKVTSVDKDNGVVNLERLSKDGDKLFHGKGPKMEKGSWFGTLFPVSGTDAINTIFGNYKNGAAMNNEFLESCKRLLFCKENIILQGAPGTGKTYNTAALALSVIGKLPSRGAESEREFHKKVMDEYEKQRIKFDDEGNVAGDGQIGFVTFHQSMDYEDFVEGYKPQKDGDGVAYDIEDGIFKKIRELAFDNYEDCQKTEAEVKLEMDTKTVFEQYCSKIESELKEKDYVDLIPSSKLKVRKVFRRADGSAKSISISRTSNSPNQTLSLDIILRDYQKYKSGEIKKYEDIKPKYESNSPYHGNAPYYFELLKKMKEFEDKNQISAQTQKVELKNYVLIIDEINRGNVSKIFGELISLLETDKRVGGDHPLSVTLPYSKESFSVPSNLYIIGTMNTTDRSVGSIDYAVRRRFAFVTLEADESLVPEGDARNLFNAVKNFLNESKYDMDIEDLMVGHSYFMDSDNLQMKWQYEILPLLMEYHKDGIISKSPLKDRSSNEIEGVKKDYIAFTSAWQEKESEETEA